MLTHWLPRLVLMVCAVKKNKRPAVISAGRLLRFEEREKKEGV